MSAQKLREAAEYCKGGVASNVVCAVELSRIAADACTTLAAQMESAEQDSRELFNTWHNDMNRTRYGHPEREAWDAAWRAAQAAMQAKLDAANERVKELEDKLHSHAPDGHNYTNGEFINLMIERDNMKAALATAERNVELLRGEVRRMDEWLDGYVVGSDHNYNRSPEVRALVELPGPSGAKG